MLSRVGLNDGIRSRGLFKQGLRRMGKVGKAIMGLLGAAWLAASATGALAQAAKEQGKALSDNSVRTLVNYAWAMTPTKFTAPDGKVIEVDKSKPQDVIVPIEVAREVIQVAWRTAHAQRCNLDEEQRANYQTLMKREQNNKKWTDQQLLFIHELHLFTVMFTAGKVKIVANDDGKDVVVNDKPTIQEPCSDTERQKVQKSIMDYVAGEAPTPAKK